MHIGTPLMTVSEIRQELLRIKQDGGLVEGKASCYFDELKDKLLLNTLILVIPNAYKVGKLYGVNGTDLNFVRATEATRVNIHGLIENVGVNIPRIDYTGGDCPSILIEPQRTNLVTHSKSLVGFWSNDAMSVQDGIPFLNGELSKKVARVGTFGRLRKLQIQNLFEDNQDYCLSVFAKKGTADLVFLNVMQKNGGSVSTSFNLTTLVPSNSFGEIEFISDEWYRCVLKFNALSGTSTAGESRITVGSSGETEFMFLYEAQLEKGSEPTSIIPTTGAIATRTADIVETPSNVTARRSVIFKNENIQLFANNLPDGRLKLIQATDDRFIMKVKSDNEGASATNQFTIPTTGTGYLYDVETSDGFTATGITGNTTITFPSGAGTHEVRITGDFPKTAFNTTLDRFKILEVLNWGCYGINQPDQTSAFFNCKNLTSIADGGLWFDTITNGTQMFLQCFLLRSLPSNMDFPLLTNGTNMFFFNKMTSLPSKMKLNSLTNGLSMFRFNFLNSLPEDMTLPLLANGSSMFNDNRLTSLPAGMKLSALTNGSGMFVRNTINTTRYSQLLVDMESGNANNNVTFHGGNSKYNATGETARDILTGATRLWTIADGGLEEVPFTMLVKSDNAGTSATNQFTIPTTGTGYLYDIETSDGFTATGITGDTTITFPSGAGTHEVRITGNFPKTFFNNVGDKNKVLEVLDWGNYGVSQPDQQLAFFGCNNLTSIASGGAWFDVVTNGSSMFRHTLLTSLPSDMNLPLIENAVRMFENCKFISLPANMSLPLLTAGFGMFLNNLLTSLPAGMELPLLTNGGFMFHGSKITDLPSGMTLPSLTNGQSMFFNNSLTSLPSGMELPLLTNGIFMFFNNSLTSLPEGMELPLLTNGQNMFHSNSLTNLPAEMKLPLLIIGSTMFFNNSLTSLPEGMELPALTTSFAMFENNSLTSLPTGMELPLLTNGTQMFRSNSLASLPTGMELPALTNGSRMFEFNSISSLPTGMELPLLTNGPIMFNGNNLSSLPAGMELPLLTNGIQMFQNNSLTSLPTGMELPLLIIGQRMFLNNSLTELPVGMELPSLTNGIEMFRSNTLTDLSTGMALPALTNGSSMFLGNTINTTRYSQLLVDMESGNANNSVPFHGGNSKYNATGETARNILTGATRLWTITDGGLEEVPFTMLVKSDNVGTSATNQFTIPTSGTGYNYNIETSDGFTATGITGDTTITFPSGAGTHEVRITGDFPKTFFNNVGDKNKVLEVLDWGNYGVSQPDQQLAFFGCNNLTSIASGGAWFDVVTNGFRMFQLCNLSVLPNDMGLPLLTNGFTMFNNNLITSLPSVMTLPLLTNGLGMFGNNFGLTLLPSGMNLPLLTNGQEMFRNCNLLSLPAGMTLSALTIGRLMFTLNTNLTLHEGLTLQSVTDGRQMFQSCNLTDLPSTITLPSLTNGSSMFLGNTINITRYSQLLVDMESGNPNNSVPFHGGNSKYNATGETARNILTGATRLWTITDGGLQI